MRFLVCLLFVLSSVLKSVQASPIILLTEHLPPYQIVEKNKADSGIRITGSSVEIVEEVFQEANVDFKMESYAWSDAYNFAQRRENVCLFSTARFPARESLFVWVGQINSMQWSLYRSAEQNFHLDRFEDAKDYRIAAIKDDASHHFLLDQGFVEDKNLYVLHAYDRLLQLLNLSNRYIDLVLLNRQLLEFRIADKTELAKYVELMVVEDITLFQYLACNLNTDKAIVSRLKQAFAELNARGELQAIREKWGQNQMQEWQSR